MKQEIQTGMFVQLKNRWSKRMNKQSGINIKTQGVCMYVCGEIKIINTAPLLSSILSHVTCALKLMWTLI